MSVYLTLANFKKFRDSRMSIREVADYFGVSTRTIQRWEDPDLAPDHVALTPHRVGRKVWYTADDIAECLRQRDQRRERMKRRKRRMAV